MQQKQYKSSMELKLLARLQTGRHLGILLGTIVLKFIITYLAASIISSLVPVSSATGYIINYVLMFAVEAAASILSVGASFIFLKTACNMNSSMEDLFYGFKNDPVKIIKIGAVIVLIESICAIPLDIATLQYTDMLDSLPFFSESSLTTLTPFLSGSLINNEEFLEAYNIMYSATMKLFVIMLVCTAISLVLTLPFFPAYYMILDFPDWSVSTILKRSFEVMNGNKLRLFFLYLSFIPSFLLSSFACGIPLIWVIPYMNMTATNFYLDLMAVRNKTVGSVS